MFYQRILRTCLILVTLLVLTQGGLAQKKEIIGYYPSWKWRGQTERFGPASIAFDKLTMINYAFFFPLKDGSLVGRDTTGDAIILQGRLDPLNEKANPGNRLVDLAHRHGVRVLLSIGGWEDSNNFPEVAAHERARARFAHSCIDMIGTYGFDGVDIDWEYPGYTDHKGTPADKSNFTLLLRTVRDSLDSYGAAVRKKYLLTAALPAGASSLANYEVREIAGLLDYLNVMTYDFNGPWDSLTGHNAPLYAPSGGDSARSVDAAFRLYTSDAGIPASKINIGVPFYGRAFAGCDSIGGRHSGSDTVHFSSHGSFYYDIAPVVPEYERVWDERAMVPYLINRRWHTLVSYDDEESVGYKARYVLEKGAAGIIVWEITGDVLPDGSTPLLDVLTRTFQRSKQ